MIGDNKQEKKESGKELQVPEKLVEEKVHEKADSKEAAPKPAAPPAQGLSAPAPDAAKEAPEAEKKEEAKPKKEKPSNCAACNKSIKKKRWYYRNGKYYCTERCWKGTLEKEEAPKEGAAPGK